MGVAEIGELTEVNLREVWCHEALDFTPWLAEPANLRRIADLLGVELELERTEMQVSGGGRADVVCRNPADDSVVLIENQLEWGNLEHLGQVMAYLSGLDAKTVVWIAKGFNDSHLSSFRWLNEHTTSDFAFFAVVVKALKIGDSKPAPVFEVIERPNSWDRQVREESGSLSELGQWRRAFWDYLRQRHPSAAVPRGFAGSNVNHKIEERNIRISWWLSKGNHAGAFLARIDKTYWESVRKILDPYREPLLAELRAAQERDGHGDDVDMIVDPEESCSIRLKLNPSEEANWDKIADWLESRRQIYMSVLRDQPA